MLPQSEISSDDEEASMRRPISARMAMNDQMNERARLLSGNRTMSSNQPKIHEPQNFASEPWTSRTSELVDDDPALSFVGLNALEIATVAGAKRFISQRVVQEVVNGIWSGDIIFWESLSVHTRKRAQKYQPKYVEGAESVACSRDCAVADTRLARRIHTAAFECLNIKKRSKRHSSPSSLSCTTPFSLNEILDTSQSSKFHSTSGSLRSLTTSSASSRMLGRCSTPQTFGACGTLALLELGQPF